MVTVLMFKGVSARDLGIGLTDDIGYVQCRDSSEPYICDGSVLFELGRMKINDVRDE